MIHNSGVVIEKKWDHVESLYPYERLTIIIAESISKSIVEFFIYKYHIISIDILMILFIYNDDTVAI